MWHTSLSRDEVNDKHFKITQQRLCRRRTCAVAKHPWQNIWNELRDAAFRPGRPTRPYWRKNDHTVANHDQSWSLEGLLRHAQGLCDLWPLLSNAFWRVAELVKPMCTRLERPRRNASIASAGPASVSMCLWNITRSHSKLLWDGDDFSLWAFHPNFWKENTPTHNLWSARTNPACSTWESKVLCNSTWFPALVLK